MMLRSSSTPVLGSLLSSFSDNPNHHHHQADPAVTPKHLQNHSKLPLHQSGGSVHFVALSSNSSPISPSVSEFSSAKRCSRSGEFRRVQSEGNLQGLSNEDEFGSSNPSKKCFSRRPSNGSNLETIPSFSFHNSRYRSEDEDTEEEEEEEEEDIGGREKLMAAKISDSSEMMMKKNTGFSNGGYGNLLTFDQEGREEFKAQMYLAKGLGVTGADIEYGGGGGSSGGSGGGTDFTQVAFGRDGGDNNGIEEHYKSMMEENPGNPLFLRNYAQFLYQSKGDLQGAEEYYSRAILADPKDGEILSQYAKLVWELRRDKVTATGYFERAVQAASEDSYVHAAYANFLWETEDDEEEEDDPPNVAHVMPRTFSQKTIASTVA